MPPNFVANLLDSTMTLVHMKDHAVLKTIDLIANYDPISGTISGPAGGWVQKLPAAWKSKLTPTQQNP